MVVVPVVVRVDATTRCPSGAHNSWRQQVTYWGEHLVCREPALHADHVRRRYSSLTSCTVGKPGHEGPQVLGTVNTIMEAGT